MDLINGSNQCDEFDRLFTSLFPGSSDMRIRKVNKYFIRMIYWITAFNDSRDKYDVETADASMVAVLLLCTFLVIFKSARG